ncbi:unnamed protein product, partial [Mycena citricolor]
MDLICFGFRAQVQVLLASDRPVRFSNLVLSGQVLARSRLASPLHRATPCRGLRSQANPNKPHAFPSYHDHRGSLK